MLSPPSLTSWCRDRHSSFFFYPGVVPAVENDLLFSLLVVMELILMSGRKFAQFSWSSVTKSSHFFALFIFSLSSQLTLQCFSCLSRVFFLSVTELHKVSVWLSPITCVAQLYFTVAVCPAVLCCNVKHGLLSIIYAHVQHIQLTVMVASHE